MFVLDTNTLIYYFKGQGKVKNHLWATSPKDIAIPSIVLYELEVGIAKSSSPDKRIKQLKSMCSVVKVLPFTDKEAHITAQIRANLEKSGTPIGYYDYLIAGTALANNGILITNNTKEFQRIDGLKLENWH
ncbi:MAG: type II toxin-antitoxin system VapC family toxin [Proteobacteria bacterium]|nr:type II toxin-antitoxin system VapC family toxin [Pseudomonadota bacterium]